MLVGFIGLCLSIFQAWIVTKGVRDSRHEFCLESCLDQMKIFVSCRSQRRRHKFRTVSFWFDVQQYHLSYRFILVATFARHNATTEEEQICILKKC